MSQRAFFIVLICTFFSVGRAFSQTGIPNQNPNAEHDRMYALLLKSEGISIPDSVRSTLLAHAERNHLDPRVVTKYSVFLKILYNPVITDAEKLDACDFGKRAYGEMNIFPPDLFSNFIRTHSPQKNK